MIVHPIPAGFPALVATPLDEPLYEVVKGRHVEIPPMSAYDVQVASILARLLGNHAEANQLGRVVTELLFALAPPDSDSEDRRPDVAFVSYQRWPQNRAVPRTNAWPVVPDLAIEVASPTNYAEDMLNRMVEYVGFGVSEVWLVYPSLRHVYCYRSPTQVRIWTRAEELTDSLTLPGLRLPLSSVFEEGDAAS